MDIPVFESSSNGSEILKSKVAGASTLNQVASWYAEYKACTGKSQGEQETPTALQ